MPYIGIPTPVNRPIIGRPVNRKKMLRRSLVLADSLAEGRRKMANQRLSKKIKPAGEVYAGGSPDFDERTGGFKGLRSRMAR